NNSNGSGARPAIPAANDQSTSEPPSSEIQLVGSNDNSRGDEGWLGNTEWPSDALPGTKFAWMNSREYFGTSTSQLFSGDPVSGADAVQLAGHSRVLPFAPEARDGGAASGANSRPATGDGQGSGRSGAGAGGGEEPDGRGPRDQADLSDTYDPYGDTGEGGGTDEEPVRNPQNRSPVTAGPVQLGTFYVNQTVIFAVAMLLHGATDADGDVLEVQNLTASSGTLENGSDGSWAFVPDAASTVPVTFRYEISDGTVAVLQTAQADYRSLPGGEFEGTDAADLIFGTPGPDKINGHAGNDTIIAREDSDTVHGGAGDDRIIAGAGNDVIYGGDGNDIIFAGSGDDWVSGGTGDDYIEGEAGADVLFGDDGDDKVLGGGGDDEIHGGRGADELRGDAGNDTIFGDDGDDIILGGAGRDTAFGGAGNDIIDGGADNDVVAGGSGSDLLVGGEGDDRLAGEEGDDVVQGGAGNDLAIGGSGDDHLAGDAGDDVLIGDEGRDTVEGGSGSDLVLAGADDDVIVATIGDGDDDYDGGEGHDTYDASRTTSGIEIDLRSGTATGGDTGNDVLAGIENAIGGSGDDVFVANRDANVFSGRGGRDSFIFIEPNKSGSGGLVRDRIEDFEIGDTIDVSLMDGNSNADVTQRLFFDFQQATFGGVSQLIYRYESDSDGNTMTVLRFNFDDDDDAEFEVEIVGRFELTDEHVLT
ncbi:MAG TPA: cadherin-like domain-containing protein, partial [Hyphomicrobiaceae bacterium]|nr:cadherin-like domain-containing protein [Hyphomicrobiaceae bacterium]